MLNKFALINKKRGVMRNETDIILVMHKMLVCAYLSLRWYYPDQVIWV